MTKNFKCRSPHNFSEHLDINLILNLETVIIEFEEQRFEVALSLKMARAFDYNSCILFSVLRWVALAN